jgi:hypothetical protein
MIVRDNHPKEDIENLLGDKSVDTETLKPKARLIYFIDL